MTRSIHPLEETAEQNKCIRHPHPTKITYQIDIQPFHSRHTAAMNNTTTSNKKKFKEVSKAKPWLDDTSELTFNQAQRLIQQENQEAALAILLPLRLASDISLYIRTCTYLFLAIIAPNSNLKYYQEFHALLQETRYEKGPSWKQSLDELEAEGRTTWGLKVQADEELMECDAGYIVEGITDMVLDDTPTEEDMGKIANGMSRILLHNVPA
jgi:hypothetical protein